MHSELHSECKIQAHWNIRGRLGSNYILAATLSGTGQDISITLILLDQILSADFFSEISKLFWR